MDERSFSFVLNHEVHKATRLQYCFSILCLTPDVPSQEATLALTNRLAQLAVSHVRAADLGSTLPPACTALLLIDAEVRSLPAIFERLKGTLEPALRVTLSGGGGCYPQTAMNGGGVIQQALDLMVRAKAEGGNRLYLPL